MTDPAWFCLHARFFCPQLAVDKDEDTIRAELYKRFRHQGPAYYGDMDEADGAVLADEAELEEKGQCRYHHPGYRAHRLRVVVLSEVKVRI